MESLNGARLLANIAQNPECHRQVTQAFADGNEARFFEAVTGGPFHGEFGLRASAKRRGEQFEQNLFAHDAAKLQEALAPVLGIEPGSLYVRNLDEEEGAGGSPKGSGRTGAAAGKARRYNRTRRILEDSLTPTEGKRHAELVIHPQLRIPTPSLPRPWLWIEPDFMVWVPRLNCFVPGDLKSFVVEDGKAEPGDLLKARLQVGAQLHALAHEYEAFNGDFQHRNGLIVFSTPYGLSPAPIRQFEHLEGSFDAIGRALKAIDRHAPKILTELTSVDEPKVHQVAFEAPHHYKESCLGSCILAPFCRKDHIGTAQQLGDDASNILGRDRDLDQLMNMLDGTTPVPASDQVLVNELVQAMADLGLRRPA